MFLGALEMLIGALRLLRLKEISNLQDALLSILHHAEGKNTPKSASGNTVSLVWSTMTKLVDFPKELDAYSRHGLVLDNEDRERFSFEEFVKRQTEIELQRKSLLVRVHGLGQTRFAEELHSQLVFKVNAFVILAPLDKEPEFWERCVATEKTILDKYRANREVINDPAGKRIIVVADGWSNLTRDQQRGASEGLKRLVESPRVHLIVTMDSSDKLRFVLEGVQTETFELDISGCDAECQKSLRFEHEEKMKRRERDRKVVEAAGSYSDRFFYQQSISVTDDLTKKFANANEFAGFLAKSGVGSGFLLSCSPGMGKTENLRHIEIALQNKLCDYRIIRLDLGSCLQQLSEFKTVFSFIALVSKSPLEMDKVEGGRVILLLDAFDETCPRHREKTLELLKQLKEMKLKTLVTTRLQEKEVVAEALGVNRSSIFKLDSISEEDQPKFIAGVWKEPSKDRLATNLFLCHHGLLQHSL